MIGDGDNFAGQLTTIDGKVDIIDGNVDDIKAVTENLPDSGALSSIAQKNENTSDKEKDTTTYTDAGGEQTIVEITTVNRTKINGIWLDLVNMTQNGTMKLYYKIDGSNYRQFGGDFDFVVATDNDGQYFNLNMGITDDFKVTYTESADEGADRDVPYCIVYDLKEEITV
jgi:hypothetical protein